MKLKVIAYEGLKVVDDFVVNEGDGPVGYGIFGVNSDKVIFRQGIRLRLDENPVKLNQKTFETPPILNGQVLSWEMKGTGISVRAYRGN